MEVFEQLFEKFHILFVFTLLSSIVDVVVVLFALCKTIIILVVLYVDFKFLFAW